MKKIINLLISVIIVVPFMSIWLYWVLGALSVTESVRKAIIVFAVIVYILYATAETYNWGEWLSNNIINRIIKSKNYKNVRYIILSDIKARRIDLFEEYRIEYEEYYPETRNIKVKLICSDATVEQYIHSMDLSLEEIQDNKKTYYLRAYYKTSSSITLPPGNAGYWRMKTNYFYRTVIYTKE